MEEKNRRENNTNTIIITNTTQTQFLNRVFRSLPQHPHNTTTTPPQHHNTTPPQTCNNKAICAVVKSNITSASKYAFCRTANGTLKSIAWKNLFRWLDRARIEYFLNFPDSSSPIVQFGGVILFHCCCGLK